MSRYNFFSVFLFLLIFSTCTNHFNEKRIVQGIEHLPEGLDPAYNFGIDEVQIYSQIYEPLLKLDDDYQTLKPCLAERWEASDHHRLFTVYLKPNVSFHDGTPLTAESVKFSADRYLSINPESPLLNMIKSVSVVDSLTLRFNLKYSHSIFPYHLASPYGLVVVSQNALKKMGDEIAFHPVGTGPFYFNEWKNDEIRLTAFKDYREPGDDVKQISFKFYTDRIKREQSIQNHNVDILYLVSGFSIDRLKWLGKIDYAVLSPINIIYLGFNNATFPFNNLKVRRAILKSINISKMVLNVNRGNAIVAKGPLPPIFNSNDNIKQETYNIQEAKKLLKKAGYPEGLKVKFYFPKAGFVRQTIVELIKSDLEKVGITLDVKVFNSWDEHNQACKSDSSQMFLSGGRSEMIGDPENFLYSLFHSGSEDNILNYENKQVDKWLEEARSEPVRAERNMLYQKIVKVILEDTPAVFLYHVKPHFAYNRKKIKSLPVNPYGIIQYHRIVLNE